MKFETKLLYGIGQSYVFDGTSATWKRLTSATFSCRTLNGRSMNGAFSICMSTHPPVYVSDYIILNAAEVWTGCLFIFRQHSNFGSRCLNGHCRQIHTILRSPSALLQVSKEQDWVEPDSGLGLYQISEEIKVHWKFESGKLIWL